MNVICKIIFSGGFHFVKFAVSLVGQAASPEVLQKLTYLVLMHSQIKRIDTVRAYTFGVLYFVEVYTYKVKLQQC